MGNQFEPSQGPNNVKPNPTSPDPNKQAAPVISDKPLDIKTVGDMKNTPQDTHADVVKTKPVGGIDVPVGKSLTGDPDKDVAGHLASHHIADHTTLPVSTNAITNIAGETIVAAKGKPVASQNTPQYYRDMLEDARKGRLESNIPLNDTYWLIRQQVQQALHVLEGDI